MTSIKDYRPSASLILAGKQTFPDSEQYDYSVLLIKRTERTSFALNHCVFPGGVFDLEADESNDWLDYLHSSGVQDFQLELLHSPQTSERPELMTQGRNFTRDISLRLTALREAFEEVGILLCQPRCSVKNLTNTTHAAHVLLQPFDRELWQHRVHQDAKQFLQLCRYLDVIPDLWALSEWSVWRTPASATRKYDLVYYFAALESSNVPLLPEPTEVASVHWLHPGDCWRQSQESIIWLPFMLLYETARLMNMQNWKQLLQFASQRSSRGSTLFQPIYYRCDGCLLGVLPGDELYLDQPQNYTESIILPDSIEEVNRRAKHYHRYIIYDFHRVDLACNIQPLDEHLPLQALVNTQLAKL
ncbi:acyl-coenzyme A diphosphatase NUDT19 [Drosophila nasuta]|uniref:Acyl-coenzyme A diphosphatase NUDT19 n=1 Tax=Drosophila albomicans TaxID=7291 RepID=A0A6P8XLG5_DROAB|nr:acyl-coenzyme A diphosphatase NUDT19 [Drosophila albomicans]XP_060657934.1 acyl-coenzyme A diphosphatase NUDT19 [Drosophila nasuta]